MKKKLGSRWALLPILTLAVFASAIFGQEPAKDQEKASEPPAFKLDAAAVRKLVEQLGSSDFKTRDKAGKELAKLADVPDALRDAAKNADLETRRRAQTIVDIITARLEEKAFQAMVADLHKVELDRFVRRMITDEKFAGDEEWKVIEKVAKVVIKRANDLAGRKYPVPDFNSMPVANLAVERVGFGNRRMLVGDPNVHITSVQGSVLLCTGLRPWITSVSNSIVIVDGDFAGATGLDNSLLIVFGKLGRFTSVRGSIILVNGEFGVKEPFGDKSVLRGSTTCDGSFIQCKTDKLRSTRWNDCVLIKTVPLGNGQTPSRVLDTDKGPLQMLKFSAPKIVSDEKLVWGKEVKGLAVALAPADRPDSYLLRWKNVGKQTLELQTVRALSDILGGNDDLLNHVFVKDSDGQVLPARKPRFPRAGGPRFRPDTNVLEPGKTYEETIDLPTYVDRPAAKGRYKMSIELEIITAFEPSQKGATYWTGKIQSNELEITFGK